MVHLILMGHLHAYQVKQLILIHTIHLKKEEEQSFPEELVSKLPFQIFHLPLLLQLPYSMEEEEEEEEVTIRLVVEFHRERHLQFQVVD